MDGEESTGRGWAVQVTQKTPQALGLGGGLQTVQTYRPGQQEALPASYSSLRTIKGSLCPKITFFPLTTGHPLSEHTTGKSSIYCSKQPQWRTGKRKPTRRVWVFSPAPGSPAAASQRPDPDNHESQGPVWTNHTSLRVQAQLVFHPDSAAGRFHLVVFFRTHVCLSDPCFLTQSAHTGFE